MLLIGDDADKCFGMYLKQMVDVEMISINI